jgi:hypothetical protein
MSARSEVVAELVDELMTISGAVAVVLGGSPALGTGGDESDWALGVPDAPDGPRSAILAASAFLFRASTASADTLH